MNYKEIRTTIASENISISFIDEGKKGAPVILFIHGFPFNKSMWDRQVEILKENWRVIAYDVRGHGSSDAGDKDFSIGLFVKDLLSLMDALKIDKTILCGLSMGGYIALNAIENYQGRFSGLILCDTNCIADTPEVKEKRMNAIENIRKNGVEKYAEESIKNLFAPGSFTSRKEEVADVKRMILNTSEQSLCKTLMALSLRKETCTRLSEIKVPVLIMAGEEDILTPPAAAKLMHEKIEGSVLQIIKNAGHLSNLENTDEFNDHLKRFVASVC